jgi:hypothetical protein
MTLWLIGQLGIIVELIGAGLGVWFAFETWRSWRSAGPATYDTIGRTLERPKEEFISQFPKQLAAFGLIGLGLALQFIGNFANR